MFLRASQDLFNMSEYHYLVPLDEVGHGHLEQLKDYAFRQKLRQLIKDVNFLLFLKEQDFWTHLQAQDQLSFSGQPEKGRLRMFLESCLSVFSKKVYMSYSQDSDQQLLEYLKTLPGAWISLWFQLKKIVFFIFFRISKASKASYRETLFDCWLLDNSKALDICLIYGPSNKVLVKELIENMYRCYPQQYQNEYRQILQLTADRLEDICGQIQVCNYDVDEFLKSERKEERYHQPYEVLYQSSAGLMFKICDVLWNLQAVFEYFPGKCRRLLSESALIHKRFIMIYCKLRQNLERKWKLSTLKSRLQAFVSLISQRIASFLQTSLGLIHEIIERVSPLLNDKTKLRHLKKTYLNVCFFTLSSPALFYVDRDNKQLPDVYLSYTETLCSQLLLRSRRQNIFNVEGTLKLFNRNHSNFTIIHRAAAFQRKLKENLDHLKILMQMENWRLKPFSEYQEEIRIKQDRDREEKDKTEAESEKMREQAKKKIDSMPTYNDEPSFDEEASTDICWDVFWSGEQGLPNTPGRIDLTTRNKMETTGHQSLNEWERAGQHEKKQIVGMDSLDISIIHHHLELHSDGESLFQSQVQTSGLTPTVSDSDNLSQLQGSVDN